MNKQRKKSFLEMSEVERNRDVAKYDKEINLPQSKPLTLKQQLLHLMADQRGRRKRIFAFKIDSRLLERAGRVARQRGLTIDQLIEQSVRGAVQSSRQ